MIQGKRARIGSSYCTRSHCPLAAGGPSPRWAVAVQPPTGNVGITGLAKVGFGSLRKPARAFHPANGPTTMVVYSGLRTINPPNTIVTALQMRAAASKTSLRLGGSCCKHARLQSLRQTEVRPTGTRTDATRPLQDALEAPAHASRRRGESLGCRCVSSGRDP